MKKFTYLFFILFLFNTWLAAAEAQEMEEIIYIAENERRMPAFRIGTGLGFSFSGYRDETDLPLNRYNNSFALIFDGNIENEKFLYSFNSNVSFGKNKSIKIDINDNYFSYFQKESNSIRASFENALDYRLWGNDVFPGYLGGGLKFDIYFVHLPETFYYNLTAVLSLNAHASQKWIINSKNTFVFSASLPVFGYSIRPPYYGLLYSPLDFAMDFVSLHNYWALFSDVKYNHKINNLISFYANLGAELSHINFPQPRKEALLRLNAGISFTF